jgi:hypothetical protein
MSSIIPFRKPDCFVNSGSSEIWQANGFIEHLTDGGGVLSRMMAGIAKLVEMISPPVNV